MKMHSPSLLLTIALAACVACDSDSLGDAGRSDASSGDDASVRDADDRADSGGEDAASPDALALDGSPDGSADASPDAAPDAEPEVDAGEDLRMFRTPELVERRDSESADAPSLGVAANGDVVVVWAQRDSDTLSTTDIYGTRAQGGITFPMPAIIDGLREFPGLPVSGIAPNGHAIAAWYHVTGTTAFVWTNRFTPNVGWEGPLPIYGSYPAVGRIRAAIDAMGRAIVVWTDEVESHRIWMSRFENGMWTDAARLDFEALVSREVDLAIGPSGEALAVWSETSTSVGPIETDIVARRFNPISMVWAPAERIEMMVEEARAPQVAFDAAGGAIAAWTQGSKVFAAHVLPGGSWEVPVQVSVVGVVEPASLVLAVGEAGHAIAAWKSSGAAAASGIFAARARPGAMWLGETFLEPDPAVPSDVAVDPLGHGVLVWSDPGVAVHARRLFGGSWSAPVPLTGGGEQGGQVSVGLDQNGNGIAVWIERPAGGGLASVWGSRFID